jgi:hypothetical protein
MHSDCRLPGRVEPHSCPHFCRALKNQAAVGAIPKRNLTTATGDTFLRNRRGDSPLRPNRRVCPWATPSRGVQVLDGVARGGDPPTEEGVRSHPVAIESQHCLIFGNCFLEPALVTPELASGIVRHSATRRPSQGTPRQVFGAQDIRGAHVGHIIYDATHECCREPALRLSG